MWQFQTAETIAVNHMESFLDEKDQQWDWTILDVIPPLGKVPPQKYIHTENKLFPRIYSPLKISQIFHPPPRKMPFCFLIIKTICKQRTNYKTQKATSTMCFFDCFVVFEGGDTSKGAF